MADRTAWRLCNQSGIMSAIVKTRKRRGKKPGPPVCDDLVQRNATAEGPNQLWLVDITEHRTREGKIYLCAVQDVFSRRIVGYSIAARMKARIAVDALNNAVARRGDVPGCVVHSDRGSQFRSRKFLRALEYHGLFGSIGRVGAAGDNAAMESLFALLQNNVLDRRTWITREQLCSAIVVWIERKYHRKRRQAALGRLTPIEFKTMMATPVTLAA
jgi:putative transposase